MSGRRLKKYYIKIRFIPDFDKSRIVQAYSDEEAVEWFRAEHEQELLNMIQCHAEELED